jgi:hypothetical protein
VTKAKSKVPPHPFLRDPDLPPDVNGRYVCATPGCRLVGEPDDAHHTLPTVPEQAEHRQRYERDGT